MMQKILSCFGILGLLFAATLVYGKSRDFQVYESQNTPVTAEKLAEPGKFTIIEFYVGWCETCKLMPDYYKTWMKNRPDTAIKRIHMPDDVDFAATSKRHAINICATPHFEIYTPDGKLYLQDQCRNSAAFDYIFRTLAKMQN